MAIAEMVAASRPGMRVEHHQFESAPPMATVDEGRFAERAATAIRSTGVISRISGEPFTTNGNHFAAAGIPTIVTGPGDIAQAHLPDEWIALDELVRGVAGYLAIMQS
jgi:acetylornithine deacetylase